MDHSTAIALALSSMLTNKDIQEAQPQNLEEVIEMIKSTPTGEISKNLERSLILEEVKTQKILMDMVRDGKVNTASSVDSPFCEGN